MMSRGIFQAEFHEKNVTHNTEGSARSIQSLDTAVLMDEVAWRPKSQMTCETWRSEKTTDTGLLLQNPETFVSDSYSHTNFRTDRSDVSKLDTRVQRRSTAFDMDDFVNSSGDTTLRDLSPRTNASLDTKVLLRDPGEKLDYIIKTGQYGVDSYQHFSESSDELDEDDSSVDPLDDLVSARTVASLSTEVLLRPTEELAKVLGSRKAQNTGRHRKETHQVRHNLQEMSNLAELELSSTRAIIPERQRVPSCDGIKSEISDTLSQHSKTKPPAPKSFSKDYDSSRISSQRCLSDIDFFDHDETSPEIASTLLSNGEEISRRGTKSNIEQGRMNDAYTRRLAQYDNNTTQPDSLHQRFKSSQMQRSNSALRSRAPSLSSVLDSPRSVETSISLGQRIVRKSQENQKKTRQTKASERNGMSQSFIPDDSSSCISSQNSTLAFHDQVANSSTKTKKRNRALNRVQEDILDGALGLTVKGSTVPSRPLSSSLSLQEMSTNEWTRRKKYNPRQSLQTEASWKRNGRLEGKPAQRNDAVKESEQRQRTSRNCAPESSAKTAPSTSSEWTDNEGQQQFLCGRDLSAVSRMSTRVKRLSSQVIHILRKIPEFEVNEKILLNSEQTSSDTDSLENTSPEFLYIIRNLEAAERQMSAVFKALSSEK